MYLITFYKNGFERYYLSRSRNAAKHCELKRAKQVRVYDRNGWLLSMAESDDNGKIFRPKIFFDGEPKQFYAEKFKDLQ